MDGRDLPLLKEIKCSTRSAAERLCVKLLITNESIDLGGQKSRKEALPSGIPERRRRLLHMSPRILGQVEEVFVGHGSVLEFDDFSTPYSSLRTWLTPQIAAEADGQILAQLVTAHTGHEVS
jgi:hypothetical protein